MVQFVQAPFLEPVQPALAVEAAAKPPVMSANVKAITFMFLLLWYLTRAHHCAPTGETVVDGILFPVD